MTFAFIQPSKRSRRRKTSLSLNLLLLVNEMLSYKTNRRWSLADIAGVASDCDYKVSTTPATNRVDRRLPRQQSVQANKEIHEV